jgi:hypothetical protein
MSPAYEDSEVTALSQIYNLETSQRQDKNKSENDQVYSNLEYIIFKYVLHFILHWRR